MTDRRDDNDTPERQPRTTPEGVRILGAEEAQAVLEGGQVARKRGDEDMLRYGDVPARPVPPSRPTVRFPLPDAGTEPPAEPAESPPAPAGPSEAARAASDSGHEPDEPSGPVKLPHWTEPPTGEILQILPEAEPVDMTGEEDVDAWAGVTGQAPRFRSGAGDWAESDYQPGESLKDDASSLGALAHHEEPDDDASFEEAVAARRRRGTRRISATAGGAPAVPTESSTAAGAKAPGAAPAGKRRAAATPPGSDGVGAGAGAAAQARRRPGLEPDGQPAGAPAPTAPPPTLGVRAVTGIGVAAFALLCFALGSRTATALAAVVVAMGAAELYTAFQQQGYHPANLVGVVGSAGLVIAAYNYGLEAFPIVTALVVIFSLLWYLFEVVHARPTVNFGMTMAGYGYVGFLGGFAGLLLAAPDENGMGLLLGGAFCAVGHDVFGYLVGSQFGRKHITPKTSPNKTLEGLLGGMGASVIIGVIYVQLVSPWDLSEHGTLFVGLVLGVVMAVMAPLGDLCESMLKRDLGIKDLGAILPGHGGVLDRFDAVLFCLPAVYYLARWLKII